MAVKIIASDSAVKKTTLPPTFGGVTLLLNPWDLDQPSFNN